MNHFIDILDFSSDQIFKLVKMAIDYKLRKNLADKPLIDKNIGLIFEKPSLRTRVSFEVGIKQLGGNAITLKSDEIGLGKRESIKDVAHVLSRYLDLVMIRTFSHEILKKYAQYSQCPVINGLSDYSHPCQALADAMTIYECFGKFDGLKVVFLGDGNNVCRSLVEICKKLNMTCIISTPRDFLLAGHSMIYEEDPYKAIQGADVIYTDTWVSMGEENKSVDLFKPYQVHSQLMQQSSPNSIFLHCLPAHRGDEVTDDVIDSIQSKVYDQAENRLHAQKAILSFLLCH